MARTVRITEEMLISAGTALVLREGLSALNIRRVAAELNCSIQPIFKNFGSMENLRRAILEEIGDRYAVFLDRYIDKSDYLFTISLAHILLAKEEKHIFGAMFLTNEFGVLTVDGIVAASWNRETIECTAKQFGLSIAQAEAVYRDVRFYTFGIAREIYAGSVIMEPDEAKKLLRGAIESFCSTAKLRKEG